MGVLVGGRKEADTVWAFFLDKSYLSFSHLINSVLERVPISISVLRSLIFLKQEKQGGGEGVCGGGEI